MLFLRKTLVMATPKVLFAYFFFQEKVRCFFLKEKVGERGNRMELQTKDAFSNPIYHLGAGSQSPLEGTQYHMTRMTANYALLNTLYRENWVVQNVVGLVVDDMLRQWFTLTNLSQKQQQLLRSVTRVTHLRTRLADGLRWGRLYGGAAGLILLRGQEHMLDKPLEQKQIFPDSFAGLYILDRWSGIFPSGELVSDMSDPDFNLPEFYTIQQPNGEMVAKVHHSRIVRFTGRELPLWEQMNEQYWGESEVEAIYQDVVAHDNVSANMADLTFQANLSTMEVQNLEQLFSLGSGEQQRRFWNVLQAQSVMRSNYGVQLVNKGDSITTSSYSFVGLKEVYEAMCLNLCGASHYPMTKLFGRSPDGMNATGESDLRNYYDYVDTLRESKLRPVLEKLLPIVCMSTFGVVPDGVEVEFPSLWTPTAKEQAEIEKLKAETVLFLERKSRQKELQE